MAYVNKRGNMPCWTKIYAIFGTLAERVFWKKKSTAQKHIQIFSMLRSGFFIRKTPSLMVPRFGFFFQDSRIRVNSKWTSAVLSAFLKTASKEILVKVAFDIIHFQHMMLFNDDHTWLSNSAVEFFIECQSKKNFAVIAMKETSDKPWSRLRATVNKNAKKPERQNC